MWEHCVKPSIAVTGSVDREFDWVIKHKLIEGYRDQHGLPLTHPRVALLDLQYHDISRGRGLFYKLQDAGLVEPGVPRHRDPRPVATAADHAGPAARRVHPPGQGAQARLHGRLGAPEAERPGPAHRPLQGPVPSRRRAGREAHRQHVTSSGTFRLLF